MGKRYNQLSFKDRVKIQILSELGLSARKIAVKMGRSNKTISTEIERCQKGEYCAEEAHSKALRTKALSPKYTKLTQGLEHTLKDLLGIGFSPEQISGRLSVEFKNISISRGSMTKAPICTLIVFKPLQSKAYRRNLDFIEQC